MAHIPESPSDGFPRAPTQEEWDALTPEQRARVVASLPGEVTDAEMSPPEGDRHFHAKTRALDALRNHFGRLRRSVYVAAELPVYYPGAKRFAPDLLVVLDAPVHERDKWMVSAEGKGLDVVLEVHVGGDRKKDAEYNVRRYASLGIPEYFIFDGNQRRLLGYCLPDDGGKIYRPIVPQRGRYASARLGLELQVEEGRLRFFHGNALVLESDELIERLEHLLEQVTQRAEEEARRAEEETRRAAEETRRAAEETRRAAEEARRAEEETRRAEEEARKREEAERRLAKLTAELERLRRKL